MRHNEPSNQKVTKNPPIDEKKVVFIGKRLRPPSEIVVVEQCGDKAIISNGQNTIKAEVPLGNIIITSLACCKTTKEATDFLSESYR